MPKTCIITPGNYPVDEAMEVGVMYKFDVSGTGWVMSVIGAETDNQRFLLVCGDNNGAAINEIIGGLPDDTPLDKPKLVTCQRGSVWMQRNIAALNTTPMVQYIYDATNARIYPVKQVIDNNTIELLSSCGVADTTAVSMQAWMCRGVSVSKIEGSIDTGGNIEMLRPYMEASTINRIPGTSIISWNNLDGPCLLSGSDAFVNIHFEPSEQRLS